MICEGQTIAQYLEEWMPKTIAVEDDRIGLQVGTLNKPVRRVLVTLDVLENVVDEAIEKGIDLIVSHHAVVFRPLRHLRTDLPSGRIYEKLLKNDIAVYVAHTNLDSSEGGLNDLMASRLGLQETEVLSPVHTEELVKVVVFVPESHLQPVLSAMGDAGAGWIGNYSHCTFRTSGIGTFLPREGTNPFIGRQGKLEQVNEFRLETIVPKPKLKKVIASMLQAHPYEEVAYDLYPLDQPGKTYGIGRVGKLPSRMTLIELARKVKEAFGLEGLRYVGEENREIERVAVVAGSGRDFIQQAAFKGADCLVTGDIGYHDGHAAMALGLALIDGGHHMEKIMKEAVAGYLAKRLREGGFDTEVLVSGAPTDPFRFLI